MSETTAMVTLDESLSIVAVTPEAAALLGVPPAGLLGRPCRAAVQCFGGGPAGCPARRALAGEPAAPAGEPAAPGGEPAAPAGEPAAPVTRALASGRTLTVSAQPLLEAGGRRRAVLCLRQPAPAQVLGIVSRRLLPLDGVEENLESVLHDLRLLCGSDLAAVALYEQERREVGWRLAAGNVTDRIRDIRLRPAQGFAGRIVASRRPLRTAAFPADLTRDPASYPIFLHEDLRSAFGVPLEVQGRPVGVLMLANRTDRAYGEEERQLLQSVAEVIALAAQNLRLYREATRRSAAAERRRLAEDVHDGLSQHLYGLHLMLADVQAALAGGSPGEVQAGLAEACRTLDKSLAEVRRLIGRLRGEDGDGPGLVAALCDYLEYFHRMSSLDVELSLNLPPGHEVRCAHAEEILRIGQEALVNAHRHAGARRVEVELVREGNRCRLRIQDDGRGFDPDQAPGPGHYGLEIMRERARRSGSRLEIRSAPGCGTAVTVEFAV